MSAADPAPEAELLDLQQILAGKYFFLSALTVLLYDYFLTLPEEVETVWKRRKTWILYLYLLVRYYAILAVIVVTWGFFSTSLTREQCTRWMLLLPLGITMPLALLPGILMVVRVYALWDRNKLILYGLSIYLLAQMSVGFWEYTVKGSAPAPLPLDNYEFHFCIYLPPENIGRASTMFVSMELAFDSIIFLLTLSRTILVHMHRRRAGHVKSESSDLIESLVRDGAFYFGAIFSFNFTWVLMILYAPTGLRGLASIPSSCVTTVMICRITLNLRTTVYGPARVDARTTPNAYPLEDVGAARLRFKARRTPAIGHLEIGVHTETEFDGVSNLDDKDGDQNSYSERAPAFSNDVPVSECSPRPIPPDSLRRTAVRSTLLPHYSDQCPEQHSHHHDSPGGTQ